MSIEIKNCGDLKNFLNKYSDDTPIIAQTVANNGQAWNLFMTVYSGDEAGFKWNLNPVIIKLHHPQLQLLSHDAFGENDEYKRILIDLANALGFNITIN